MRRFAALRRHGFHVRRRPARDPRQWLSGHSSPSTDNARNCGRSPLRRRWALPAAFLRHRLLHFIEIPRSVAAIAGAGASFRRRNQLAGGATASAISTIACGDSDGPARRLRMQSLHPHQRLGLNSSCTCTPLPAQHVCVGLTLNVAPKVAVRRRGSFDQTIQMVNEFHGDAGGHHQSARAFTAADVLA